MVQNSVSLAEAVATLYDLVPKLAPKDRGFARSLIDSFNDHGGKLSPKQDYWVRELCNRAEKPKPVPPQEQVGDFSGVYKLFQTAKQKLQHPKIMLKVKDLPVVLYMSGMYSKAPNTIQVTDGAKYPYNIWYGRVDQAGIWTQSLKGINEEDLKAVRRLLKEFSKEPAKVAKEYGALTGRCCFCHLPLSDKRSTAAGFGQTCAKNYGLEAEWKAATAVLDKEQQ